jgi:hypothetical protein
MVPIAISECLKPMHSEHRFEQRRGGTVTALRYEAQRAVPRFRQERRQAIDAKTAPSRASLKQERQDKET